MVNIQVDEDTATTLQNRAAELGLSVSDFLRSVASDTRRRSLAWDALESEINAASYDGPSLPAELSRADIYDSHD
jgi:hypothetical protein